MSDEPNSADEQREISEVRKARRRTQGRAVLYAKFLERNDRIFNVLSTTVTALFTVVLATSTVFLWKETKDLRNFAEEQSADMKASIAEAARSAVAMQLLQVFLNLELLKQGTHREKSRPLSIITSTVSTPRIPSFSSAFLVTPPSSLMASHLIVG